MACARHTRFVIPILARPSRRSTFGDRQDLAVESHHLRPPQLRVQRSGATDKHRPDPRIGAVSATTRNGRTGTPASPPTRARRTRRRRTARDCSRPPARRSRGAVAVAMQQANHRTSRRTPHAAEVVHLPHRGRVVSPDGRSSPPEYLTPRSAKPVPAALLRNRGGRIARRIP